MPRAKAVPTAKEKKEDILESYNIALGNVETEGINSKQASLKLKQSATDLSSKLKRNISDLTENLNSAIDETISQIDLVSGSLTNLYDIKIKQEQAWDREKEEIKKSRAREEEEYAYQLKKKRQIEDDSWEIEKEKREKAIFQREKELKESDDELKDLRNKDKMFEARLAKAINDAIEDAKKKLSLEYSHKEALLASQNEAQKLLLESKIESLSRLVSNYQVEIERLNKQMDSASERLTEIASGAVRNFKINQTSKDNSNVE